ncbi:MAG: PAS domain S-box protein [Candidatus Krumholzibacteriia bacterium]
MLALFVALAENIALLLALALIYSFALRRWRRETSARQVVVGLAIGAVAVGGMLKPVPLQPGLFFDGRSIVLGVGALVGGPLAALLAAVTAGALRIAQGGVGVAPGLLTILSSSALGLLFRRLRASRPAWRGDRGLLLFGLAVHVGMLLCMFALPPELAWETVRRIGLPVLTLFPLGTLMLGKLLNAQAELVRSREALEATRRVQQAILDSIPDSAWMKDADGRYLGVNSPFEELCGLPAGQIHGRHDGDIWADAASAARYSVDDAQVLHTRERLRVEERVVDNAGLERWVETVKTPVFGADGAAMGTVGIARDITERRRNELELRRLATALKQSSDAVMMLDVEGTITYVNPAFELMSGYPQREAIGRLAVDLQAQETHEAAKESLRLTLAGGSAWRGPVTWRGKDGGTVETLATVNPISGERGELAGFVAVHVDRSELRQLEERLVQAQKMEAIGTLAGGIAHDFNNILGAIIGYAEMAEQGLDRQEDCRRYMAEVLAAANRARELVRQILSFSRRQTPAPESIPVARTLDETMGLLRATLPSSLELRVEERCGDCRLFAAPVQLEQVLLNLCTNASQALAGRPGRVDILVERLTLDAPHRWGGADLLPGPYVHLRVADDGPGLDPALLPRVCEPFFTTKPAGEGTGMGLSVVHGIVTSLGGSLDLESRLGRGFAVDILLPELVGTPAPAPEALPAVSASPARILVAEDEAQLRELYREALTRAGHVVETVARGDAALDRFRREPAAFDLIVTDLGMPGLSGERLSEEARKLRPGLPILLITGYTEPVVETRLKQIGVAEICQKPLGGREIVEAVGRILTTRAEGA